MILESVPSAYPDGLRGFAWDATSDLAQATWEWPKRQNPSKALWQAYASDFWSGARLVKATWAKP